MKVIDPVRPGVDFPDERSVDSAERGEIDVGISRQR
jgi:hypothetical protein